MQTHIVNIRAVVAILSTKSAADPVLVIASSVTQFQQPVLESFLNDREQCQQNEEAKLQ